MFASKEQAFPILFELCRNYEMNNVLHNEVVKLISLSFTDNLLSQAVFFSNNLSYLETTFFSIFCLVNHWKMQKFVKVQENKNSEKDSLGILSKFPD